MSHSIKVKDVEGKFKSIPQKGRNILLKNIEYFSNIVEYHVQGITSAYDEKSGTEYTVISHSNDGVLYGGGIEIQKTSDSSFTKKIIMPKNMKHPGGLQAIGPFIFIPCEYKPRSSLFVYDVRALEDEKIDGFCYRQDFSEHAATCVGITDVVFENKDGSKKEKYLLAINAESKCYFYTSDICDEKDDDGQLLLNFSAVDYKNNEQEYIDLSSLYGTSYSNFEGIGLVTDENGTPYLIAFTCNKEGKAKHNVDRMLLAKVKISKGVVTLEELENADDGNRKMIAVQKNRYGKLGVHFRWGVGLYITTKAELEIKATARVIMAVKTLEANKWSSAKPESSPQDVTETDGDSDLADTIGPS